MIPVQTLYRFIHAHEQRFPASTGEFSDLLSSIALAAKIIGQLIATAGFKGLYGYSGTTNVHGEERRALDEQADMILSEILGSSKHFGLMVSEEHDKVISSGKGSADSKYIVAFDPLDGSSNINSNIPVGTIFAIYRRQSVGTEPQESDFFCPARKCLAAAGYALYGPRTSFVYTFGDGVYGFTLDPSLGEFVLTEEKIVTPEKGKIYSINEGNSIQWHGEVSAFIHQLKLTDKEKGTPYSARYAGSLVADFDRNLRNGGIFLYPGDTRYTNGKLRLLYECAPLAFISEQAKGKATDGVQAVLDIVPNDIHQRTPFICGSRTDVEWFETIVKRK